MCAEPVGSADNRRARANQGASRGVQRLVLGRACNRGAGTDQRTCRRMGYWASSGHLQRKDVRCPSLVSASSKCRRLRACCADILPLGSHDLVGARGEGEAGASRNRGRAATIIIGTVLRQAENEVVSVRRGAGGARRDTVCCAALVILRLICRPVFCATGCDTSDLDNPQPPVGDGANIECRRNGVRSRPSVQQVENL